MQHSLPPIRKLEAGKRRLTSHKSLTLCVLPLLILVPLTSACRENKQPTLQPSTSNVDPAKGKLFDIDADVRRNPQQPPQSSSSPVREPSELASHFNDVAVSSNLDFVYETGARGMSLMVETMGGGGGVIDFDADGAYEVFFCQGGDPTSIPTDRSQPTDRIYRNLGELNFLDVSSSAIPASDFAYSQGVAIGDFDDDGFDDIYVTNVGKNQLLRNMGDGTFLDVSQQSGTSDSRWSSSAAFADLNEDGLLDLYVCNYVLYDPLNPIECKNDKGQYRICHPREMEPVPDACFINKGDGTFADESAARGLTGDGGKGLGVAIADFNVDGRPDVYVANDTTANFYFVNLGNGTFKDQALLQGCAMDRTGAYQASMGLGIGDYNQDGLLDIYSSHFYDDSNTLYQNLGPAGFQDSTAKVGLHEPTLEKLGFGAIIEDFNFDGMQEIFVTNGHIENYPDNKLHQMSPQLFAYNGTSFAETTTLAGDYFREKYVGRGVCQADFDSDGDLDFIVVHQDQPAALLQNQTLSPDSSNIANHFVNFQFHGTESNRRGIGCKVTVSNRNNRWFQQLIGGGSYASSRQPKLFFGVGPSSEPVSIEVIWPSGKKQLFEDIAINRSYSIHEQRGILDKTLLESDL